MTLKVQVHALAKPVLAQERRVHSNELRTLLVYSEGVEVVNFLIRLGSNWMRERRRILRKLRRTQVSHVCDTLDRARVQIGRKLMVSEHSQTFLERQLKPVAAGDAVARVVVKIFVTNDSFDALKRRICRALFRRQHQARIKNVQRLVFHRAHVEVVHGDDVEQIQIVLQTKAILVPLHRSLQACHGEIASIDVLCLRVNLERHFATTHGRERVLDHR